MHDSKPPKPFPVVYVVVPVAIVVLIAFLALWQFLTPRDNRVVVAYSDFIADVHAGKVDEIVIQGRDIRYRLVRKDGHASPPRQTVGPIPDQALLESLKPTDPNAPLPRIVFEK